MLQQLTEIGANTIFFQTLPFIDHNNGTPKMDLKERVTMLFKALQSVKHTPFP